MHEVFLVATDVSRAQSLASAWCTLFDVIGVEGKYETATYMWCIMLDIVPDNSL